MRECAESHSREMEETTTASEWEEVTFELPIMFNYWRSDSRQINPMLRHMVVEFGEPEERDRAEDGNTANAGEEGLLDEKEERQDGADKICVDVALEANGVRSEESEEQEYWTANEEEDGYETATEEESWEKCETQNEKTTDVADADFDGVLEENGRDCPLQSRCSYTDDVLMSNAAIWEGAVVFDEMEIRDSNDEVSMRSQELKLCRDDSEVEFDFKVVGEEDRRWSCGEEWTRGGSYKPNCNNGPKRLSDQDGEHYMISMENDAECQLMGMEQGGGACDVDVSKEPSMETTVESTLDDLTHVWLQPTELPTVLDQQMSLRCDLLWQHHRHKKKSSGLL